MYLQFCVISYVISIDSPFSEKSMETDVRQHIKDHSCIPDYVIDETYLEKRQGKPDKFTPCQTVFFPVQ